MVGESSLSFISNEQAVFPEKRRALVVGVNNVPLSDTAPLSYALNDARAIAGVLEKECGFTLVREPLLGKEATSGAVVQAITSELIKDRQDDDFLLFYFAGHGLAYRRGDTIDKTDMYLGTCDFSPEVVKYVPDAHISLKLLRKLLFDEPHAGKVVIILDCCNAGNFSGYGSDPTFDDMRNLVSYYFDLNMGSAATMHGLRWCLAATTYNQAAAEAEGHGILTRWLLPALSGEVDDVIDNEGRVTFDSLLPYLRKQMRDAPPSTSGADAGRECVLAYHSKHPVSYFPYEHDRLFRPRAGEIEALEAVLLAEGTAPVRLGLVGLGGVGKSRLARELVARNETYFTDGVFWIAAGEDQAVEASPATVSGSNPLSAPLAVLAGKARYLPPGDDRTRLNEELRARHLCRFLAQHPRALLILDNLDDPHLVTTALPELAGCALQCSVLYTTRRPARPRGVHIHEVKPLSNEQDLLTVLLEGVEPDALMRGSPDQRARGLEAARSICQRVGGLPLALTLLRAQLEQNEWLTLADLDRQLGEKGVLALAYDERSIHRSLEAAFQLSWQRVESEEARRLFLLAAYTPAATPIPLWLLALACGIKEDYDLHAPLTNARQALRGLSLIEDVSREEIQLHSLLREFGQALVTEMPDGEALRQEAAERVTGAFEDVSQLEQRARDVGFWRCLAQLRTVRTYLALLNPDAEARLERVERRLDQETHFLATGTFWPQPLPGLFYQQMYNRMLEEELPLPTSPPAGMPWLRQLERVGIEDTGLIRVFSGHSGGINSVAFSPDGTRVLTGSEDGTARLFETASGRTLHILRGHEKVIDTVAYAPDGSCVLTGSRDGIARLWDAESGECIRVFEGHTDWVNGVAFSPDSELIVTGSQDETARLWERRTGQLRATFFARNEPVRLLDLFGEASQEEAEKVLSYPYAINSVAFSPGNNQIALGTRAGKIFLWNITNNTYIPIGTSSVSPITSLAYSPEGGKFLISASGRRMLLWDCTRSTLTREAFHSHIDLSSVAFSHDPTGTYFLTGSWDGIMHLWETVNGRVLHTFKKQTGTINSVAFSPDDTTILLGSSDATAQLWERPGRRVETPIILNEVHTPDQDNTERPTSDTPPLYVSGATFSSDDAYLVATSEDLVTTLWNVQSRQKLFPLPDRHGAAIFGGIRFLPGQAYAFQEHEMLITWFDSVKVLGLKSAAILRTIMLKKRNEAHFEAALSRDGHYLLIGSTTNVAYLWNATTGRAIKTLKGHTDIVMRVAFSPDNSKLLTGSRDKTARLWTRRSKEYMPMVLSGHRGWVSKVAFSLDGARAFTGSTDTLLRVWDAANGELLNVLDGHVGTITIVECSPSCEYVLAGDMFNQVRIWRIAGQCELVAAFATHSTLIAAHWQDNRTILLVDDAATGGFPRMYTLRLET